MKYLQYILLSRWSEEKCQVLSFILKNSVTVKINIHSNFLIFIFSTCIWYGSFDLVFEKKVGTVNIFNLKLLIIQLTSFYFTLLNDVTYFSMFPYIMLNSSLEKLRQKAERKKTFTALWVSSTLKTFFFQKWNWYTTQRIQLWYWIMQQIMWFKFVDFYVNLLIVLC